MYGLDLIAALTVLVAIAVAFSIVIGRDRMRRGDENEVGRIWAAYARTQKLSYVAPEGDWPNRSVPRLVSDNLQIVLVREGDRVITRLELRPRESMLGRIIVTTEPSSTDLPAVALQTKDLDHALHAFAKPPSLAESVLTRDVLRAIAAFRMGSALRVEYEKGRVILEWKSGEVNAARLDEARRLAALLARSLSAAFARAS